MVIIVLRKILIFSIGLGREPRQMDMAVLPAQEDQGIMTKNVTFLIECMNFHKQYSCAHLPYIYSKNLRTEDTLGMGHFSLVERLSSSRRFIRNCLKTNITLEVF